MDEEAKDMETVAQNEQLYDQYIQTDPMDKSVQVKHFSIGRSVQSTTASVIQIPTTTPPPPIIPNREVWW